MGLNKVILQAFIFHHKAASLLYTPAAGGALTVSQKAPNTGNKLTKLLLSKAGT